MIPSERIQQLKKAILISEHRRAGGDVYQSYPAFATSYPKTHLECLAIIHYLDEEYEKQQPVTAR